MTCSHSHTYINELFKHLTCKNIIDFIKKYKFVWYIFTLVVWHDRNSVKSAIRFQPANLQYSKLYCVLFLSAGMIHTARCFLKSTMTSHKCLIIVRLPLWLRQKHRHLVWYWELWADRAQQMCCRCSFFLLFCSFYSTLIKIYLLQFCGWHQVFR